MTHSLGISLLPGLVFGNSEIFGRIGVVYSRFKYSDNSFYLANPDPVNTGALQTNFSDNKAGLEFGLGAETMMTQHVGMCVEYDWTRYGSLHHINGPTTTNTRGATSLVNSATINIKPTISQFILGLIYHFQSA